MQEPPSPSRKRARGGGGARIVKRPAHEEPTCKIYRVKNDDDADGTATYFINAPPGATLHFPRDCTVVVNGDVGQLHATLCAVHVESAVSTIVARQGGSFEIEGTISRVVTMDNSQLSVRGAVDFRK